MCVRFIFNGWPFIPRRLHYNDTSGWFGTKEFRMTGSLNFLSEQFQVFDWCGHGSRIGTSTGSFHRISTTMEYKGDSMKTLFLCPKTKNHGFIVASYDAHCTSHNKPHFLRETHRTSKEGRTIVAFLGFRFPPNKFLVHLKLLFTLWVR